MYKVNVDMYNRLMCISATTGDKQSGYELRPVAIRLGRDRTLKFDLDRLA